MRTHLLSILAAAAILPLGSPALRAQQVQPTPPQEPAPFMIAPPAQQPLPPRPAEPSPPAAPAPANAAAKRFAAEKRMKRKNAKSHSANAMWGGRFASGPDALMEAINASIRFDRRLYAQDIAGSKAHAAMLAARGIIGKKDLRLEREMFGGETDLELSGECGVTLQIQPAKAIWGAGFWYELRRGGARITRMLDESPATRAGLQKGDEITELAGKSIETLSTDEVRSLLGAIPTEGVPMSVKHKDGSTLKVTVKEGPIYPLFSRGSDLPVAPD